MVGRLRGRSTLAPRVLVPSITALSSPSTPHVVGLLSVIIIEGVEHSQNDLLPRDWRQRSKSVQSREPYTSILVIVLTNKCVGLRINVCISVSILSHRCLLQTLLRSLIEIRTILPLKLDQITHSVHNFIKSKFKSKLGSLGKVSCVSNRMIKFVNRQNLTMGKGV